MVFKELSFLAILVIVSSVHIEARSVDGIRSDVIETKYVPDPMETKNAYLEDPVMTASGGIEDNAKKPGWLVRTYRKFFKRPKRVHEQSESETVETHNEKNLLMRFGDITSRVSNNLGGGAMRVAAIVERLCKMLKTIIPIVAAVCTVGQFKFCMAAETPLELQEALSNPRPLDLNSPDK